MGTLLKDEYIFMIMLRSIPITMRNVVDKIYRENQNTHFMFKKVSFENLAVYKIML